MNILKKSVSFLTAVAVLMLSAVIIADFPENNNVASAYSIDSYADDVAALVNEYRQQQGIEPLKVIPALQKNAQTRAVEISEEFSHTRPDGTLCFTAISSSVSYYACAENIAYGETTPEAVINQWKKSDGHNKNMLNSDYTHIGVGVYESGGYIYWVQLFVGSGSIYSDEYTPVYSPEGTTETIEPTETSEEYTTWEYTTEPTESSEEYTTWEYTTESPETTEEILTVSMWGDVTFDGRVSIADAVLLNRYLVNSATITKQGYLNADCWHDGKLSADDTVTIQKILVGTYTLYDMPIIPN